MMTRIRPGKKNDHARIEQKNYANVRSFTEYYRYDVHGSQIILNELNILIETYVNHFISSLKCVSKVINEYGKTKRRIYDKAQTPYQRVLSSIHISEENKQKIVTIHETLNPKVLLESIEKYKAQLLKMCQNSK